MPILNAPVTGSVWQVQVEVGDSFAEGDTLMVLESMKMEIPVEAEGPGEVLGILCREGDSVSEGAPLIEVSSA